MNTVVLCISGRADDRQDRPWRRKVMLSSISARCEPQIHSSGSARHLTADCRQESVSYS